MLLVLIAVGTVLTTKMVNAAPLDPYLEVKPNSYVTNQLKTFDISVWLNNITADKRLIGVQFSLKYNSTLLDVKGVTEGPFLAQFNQTVTPPSPTFFTATWNSTHVTVGIIILPNPVDPLYTVFPEGSGELATITFEGIYLPAQLYTPLSCGLELEGIMLIDDTTHEIPYLPPVNGSYEITLTLLGDINGDQKVNIADLATAALAYGAYGPDGPDRLYPGLPASPRWYPVGPMADINNNNRVDIYDLVIIAKNFGKSYL